MKKGSTLLLQGVLFAMGLIVFTVCAVFLPQIIMAELAGDFDYLPILVGLYVPAIPFFIALFQASKLLRLIDANQAFSPRSVTALKNIKFCGLSISAAFALGMPYIFYVADRDDAPGLVALGLVIIGASFVIATAAAVFQNLLQNAVDLKSENDLTV